MSKRTDSYLPAVTTEDVATGSIEPLIGIGKRRMFRVAFWEVVDEITAVGYALAPGDEPVPVGLVHYPVPLTSLGLRDVKVGSMEIRGGRWRIDQAEPPGPDEVRNVYRLASGKSKVTVKVSSCGANLCAKIVGLKEPISKIDGKPKVDRENPDPSLRKRPLIGLQILIGMKPDGDGRWKGAIYNPDDGKTYSATVKHDGGQMNVKGCVASVFCKTNKFVRVN